MIFFTKILKTLEALFPFYFSDFPKRQKLIVYSRQKHVHVIYTQGECLLTFE